MEAIIGIVILFWVITTVAGAMGKQGQQGQQGQQRKMNLPKRTNGLPPFGNPSWPTLEREQPQPSSKQPSLENRTGYEIEQRGSVDNRSERKNADRASVSTDRQAAKDANRYDRNRNDKKHDRSVTAITDAIDTDSPITNPEGRKTKDRQEQHQQKPAFLDQQQVVNGIIWSEVLGPPRSRRRR